MTRLTSCPAESDPRETVVDFVRNPVAGTIGGLRTEGLEVLRDLVIGEIRRQEPDSEIVELDREFLVDNGIDFARELQTVLEKRIDEGKRINWIISYDLPVKDWQQVLESLKGKDTQAYLFTVACRQIPCCYKLLS